MKISMFMLLAGAAIIFAAPLANARVLVTEHEVITEHSFIPHKAVKHVKTVSGKTSGATKVSPRPPLYIYVPSPPETLASTGSGLIEALSATNVQSDSSTSTASTNDQDADC